MLIEFSVENFRSIKEKITLSMVSSSDKSLDNNLIKTDVLKDDSLLRSAVIYGPNASGKSNVILAFNFLVHLVMTSHKNQKDAKINVSPFKLDKEYLSKPSKFEVVFIKNKNRYVYGVSTTSEKIIDEYLYYYPKGRKAIIFERSNTNDYNFTVDKKDQEFLKKRTLDNVLYLSNSTQLSYKKSFEAFDWFKDNLQIINVEENPLLTEFTINLLNKDEKSKELILEALLNTDLGIEDIKASVEKVSIENLPSAFPNELKTLISEGKTEFKQFNIKTTHKVNKGKDTEFDVQFEFDEESGGTQKMFFLIGPWIDVLSNGRILIVDELDTKLHNKLIRFLIKLFHDPNQNKNNAQLIFTTHNTILLDMNLFRRDQIWFTEKDPDVGSTDLYSLVEFNPRKNENIQKGYQAGRFGAEPFIMEERIF